ncbi:MAG: DoxX family membrane protein, partial [Candidatus Cloacimonetes bacterium]|nr:DoxX family membrane protein [Candidatus Cloacimonadota bacterium]
MKHILAHPATLWTCRIVLAGLFLLAAWGKISEPHDFATVIRNFKLVPRAFSNLPAIVMPWLEALAALALLSGIARRAGLWWITLMLGFFTLSFFWVMSQGIVVDCGCFGKLGAALAGDVGLKSVIRNLI